MGLGTEASKMIESPEMREARHFLEEEELMDMARYVGTWGFFHYKGERIYPEFPLNVFAAEYVIRASGVL